VERVLRTTELTRKEGLVKERALQALGSGSPTEGYTVMVSSPRRSMRSLKTMAVGLALALLSALYAVIVVFQKAFSESAWPISWWDALVFVAGFVIFGLGLDKFLSIDTGHYAKAGIFDSVLVFDGKRHWFNQKLSSLVYTGPMNANIVVSHKVHHIGKGKDMDVCFVWSVPVRVIANEILNFYKLGVEAAWLNVVNNFEQVCRQNIPAGDYDAIMAADLPKNKAWQAEVNTALSAVMGGNLLCFASPPILVDVRPPEYLRQEEEKARQERQVKEQKIADLRTAFTARRNMAQVAGDFAQIRKEIKEAFSSYTIIDEEIGLTDKAEEDFLEAAKQRAAEARERVREAAKAPVRALLTGVKDADPELDELLKLDPLKLAYFIEAQRIASGNTRGPAPLISLADAIREHRQTTLPDQDDQPRKLVFFMPPDEAEEEAEASPAGGPDQHKEELGRVPLASAG